MFIIKTCFLREIPGFGAVCREFVQWMRLRILAEVPSSGLVARVNYVIDGKKAAARSLR